MKICSVCKVSKPFTGVNKSSKHLDGLNGKCRTCKSKTNRISYHKIEEKHLELTQKELDAKILHAEAVQAEWYREEGREQKESMCFYKEHARLFWDKVEERNNDTTTRD